MPEDSKRPLSHYDNLSSSNSSNNPPPSFIESKLPFKDLRFQFDDSAAATNQNNKSVISDAKSIFFGLKPQQNDRKPDENLPLMSEQETSQQKVSTPVASKCHKSDALLQPLAPNNLQQQFNHSNGIGAGGAGAGAASGSNGIKKTISFDTNDANNGENNGNGGGGGGGVGYLETSPSQAVYMSTTVPQNISKTSIGGRHKPTRTSLRHSRMLVMGKNFHVLLSTKKNLNRFFAYHFLG